MVAQTGKAVSGRLSFQEFIVLRLRHSIFIPDQGNREENPHCKSLRTFATAQIPQASGLHHPLGALETTWPRWEPYRTAIAPPHSIKHQPSLLASVLPQRRAGLSRFGYRRDFPNPPASSPPLSQRCLHPAIRVWRGTHSRWQFLLRRVFYRWQNTTPGFPIRPALKRSLYQLIITNSQQPGAARIEEGWIFHPQKYPGASLPAAFEPDLVQHAREVDQTFRFLVIRTWILILHYAKSSRPVLKCQQSTCASRTRPLYKVIDRMRTFLQMEPEHRLHSLRASGVALGC